MATVIHPANIYKGTIPVMKQLIDEFSDLKKVLANGGYEVRW